MEGVGSTPLNQVEKKEELDEKDDTPRSRRKTFGFENECAKMRLSHTDPDELAKAFLARAEELQKEAHREAERLINVPWEWLSVTEVTDTEKKFIHAYALHVKTSLILFEYFQCKSKEIPAEEKKYAFSLWGQAIDSMATLVKEDALLEASIPEDNRLLPILDLFVMVCCSHGIFQDSTILGALVAMVMCHNDHVAKAGMDLLDYFSTHGSDELQQDARAKLTTMTQIKKEERERWKVNLARELARLPRDVQRKIQRSGLSVDTMVDNFDIFRNCLHFDSKILINHPNNEDEMSLRGSGVAALQQAKHNMKQRNKAKNEKEETMLSEKLLIFKDPKEEYSSWYAIGRGGFGEVYTAKSKTTKQKVAIKLMVGKNKRNKPAVQDKKITGSPQLRRIFGGSESPNTSNEIVDEEMAISKSTKMEILTLSSCRHTNIVNYIASYAWSGSIWVVMEYCDGGTLKSFCETASPDESMIAYICREVLQAIEYLHSRSQIHRDIKGDNILLHLSGEVKLADLGLCGSEKKHSSTIAGSKHYIAPEMLRRAGYDGKLDIWSFGCTVMEMVEGNPPYHNETSLKALFRTATEGAPRLQYPERVSPKLVDFLWYCLQFNPTMRPTATKLLKHPFIAQAAGRRAIKKAFEAAFLQQALSILE